jgi:uncharacterized protein YbaP (TraB family)
MVNKMTTEILIQQLHNDGLDEVGELIEKLQGKVAELEKELGPHRRAEVTVISLELAAQCWCDEDTSNIEMDSHLANAFAKRLDTKDKRIAELETQNQRLKVIISEREASIDNVVNDILDMDNCEQDSDEMDDYWTAIKDFALITTGRCDS